MRRSTGGRREAMSFGNKNPLRLLIIPAAAGNEVEGVEQVFGFEAGVDVDHAGGFPAAGLLQAVFGGAGLEQVCGPGAAQVVKAEAGFDADGFLDGEPALARAPERLRFLGVVEPAGALCVSEYPGRFAGARGEAVAQQLLQAIADRLGDRVAVLGARAPDHAGAGQVAVGRAFGPAHALPGEGAEVVLAPADAGGAANEAAEVGIGGGDERAELLGREVGGAMRGG